MFANERGAEERKKEVDYKKFVYIKEMKTNSQTMGSCASRLYEVN